MSSIFKFVLEPEFYLDSIIVVGLIGWIYIGWKVRKSETFSCYVIWVLTTDD